MLDHVSITVTDIGAAERFYDAVMHALRVPKVRKSEHRLGYGERCDENHPDRNYLSVKLGDRPDDAPARHWCFKAPSRAAVDAFWKAGVANGGTDNGPPGIREVYHPNYYAAFLIDPSGNRRGGLSRQNRPTAGRTRSAEIYWRKLRRSFAVPSSTDILASSV